MGISINGGTPKKWLVIRENPIKMDDVGGGTPILGNPHMVFDGQMAIKRTNNSKSEIGGNSMGIINAIPHTSQIISSCKTTINCGLHRFIYKKMGFDHSHASNLVSR